MGPDPIRAAVAWDFAFISSVVTPGLAEVTGFGRPAKWDIRKGSGTAGAATVFTGEDPTKGKLRIVFFEGTDQRGNVNSFEQRLMFFDELCPILEKSYTGKTALDFYHPACSDPPYNVTTVVIENIGQLERVDDTGLYAVTIDLLRYTKPKPAAGKPKAQAKKNQQPTAEDAADKEIQALLKQFKELADG